MDKKVVILNQTSVITQIFCIDVYAAAVKSFNSLYTCTILHRSVTFGTQKVRLLWGGDLIPQTFR